MKAAAAAAWAAVLRIDLRGWFTLALLALVWRIVEIIAGRPELLESSAFMQLVTPICGAGGLLLVASFLFGANKSEAEKTKALADNAATMREAGIPVGSSERRARDMTVEADTVNIEQGKAP